MHIEVCGKHKRWLPRLIQYHEQFSFFTGPLDMNKFGKPTEEGFEIVKGVLQKII